jgi:hypothetical protein
VIFITASVFGGEVFNVEREEEHMYHVFVQIGRDDYVFVATREDLEQAVKLVEGLRTCWPREYVVRDSNGNQVDLAGYAAIESGNGAISAMG